MPETTVLFVEDSGGQARQVETLLAGDERVALRPTPNVSEAFHMLRHRGGFEVALLGSGLLISQGTDSLASLRRGFPELPIIVLFSVDDAELARQALSKGADEILSETDLRPDTLQTAIRFAVERRRRVVAERKLRQTQNQLKTASQVQQQMLPAEAPKIAGFDIAGQCHPATQCAGDFYDFLVLPDGRLLIVIADVTSHGFAPALIMANTRRLLRELSQTHDNLGTVLTLANRAVSDESLEGQFVTILLSRLDPASRTLSYAAAGLAASIVDERGVARGLESTHMPIGLMRETVYEISGETTLQPGDILVLMTDGISEARHPSGELFGEQRALDLVNKHHAHSAQEIICELLHSVDRFCHPNSNDDDATAIVLKSLHS